MAKVGTSNQDRTISPKAAVRSFINKYSTVDEDESAEMLMPC